jgi:hypothetical protein
MTAGLPGTGVGGLFYLVAALLLPLRGLVLRMRGTEVPWATLLRQLGLAVGVFVGIWATGWLLGFMVGPIAETAAVRRYQSVVRWGALLAGFGTLSVVLLLVQMARLVVRKQD